MTPICPAGQAAGKRTAYATAMYLRRIESEHADAMYRWRHPHNIAWALANGRRIAAGCEFPGRAHDDRRI